MSAPELVKLSAWRGEVETHVRVAGSGPPLVFFHGAYGLHWDAFLDALAQRSTVYAPEFPGTSAGLPDATKPIDTLWDLVLYYEEVLDALSLDRPALVGHSFGGMVAAELAAQLRGRVRKLALLDPIGLWLDAAPVVNWMGVPAETLPSLFCADPNGAVAKALFTPHPDAESELERSIARTWACACTGKFIWPIPDRGLKKRIHRISAPTLLVWGEQDRLVPPAYAQEFAKRIRGARVERVANAGHLVQLEQGAAVAKLVGDFLAS